MTPPVRPLVRALRAECDTSFGAQCDECDTSVTPLVTPLGGDLWSYCWTQLSLFRTLAREVLCGDNRALLSRSIVSHALQACGGPRKVQR